MTRWSTTEGALSTEGAGTTEGAGGKMGKYAATRTVSRARSYYKSDWNSYEDMMKNSSIPFIGGMYKARAEYLEYQELQQWWSDYARNTGIDLSKIKYPIKAGLYRGYVSAIAPYISATESVMNLYGGGKLMRWL